MTARCVHVDAARVADESRGVVGGLVVQVAAAGARGKKAPVHHLSEARVPLAPPDIRNRLFVQVADDDVRVDRARHHVTAGQNGGPEVLNLALPLSHDPPPAWSEPEWKLRAGVADRLDVEVERPAACGELLELALQLVVID